MTWRGEALVPPIKWEEQCEVAECEAPALAFCTILHGRGINLRVLRVSACDGHLEDLMATWAHELATGGSVKGLTVVLAP